MLEQWLKERPGPEILDAWKHYIQALIQGMGTDDRDKLKKAVLEQARIVAEATGGFLGLTSKISDVEAKALADLEGSFA